MPVLKVADMQRALDFYTGVLGFTTCWRAANDGGGRLPCSNPALLRCCFRPAPISATSHSRVHEQVLRELSGLDEAELDQPVPHPTSLRRRNCWRCSRCAHHEMLHAGQIGLLRRQLGYPPMW